MEDINKFRGYLLEKDLSDNTIKSYIEDVLQFVIFLKKDIRQIEKIDILLYKKRLEDQNIRIRTINRKLVSIKNYIDFINVEEDAKIVISIKHIKEQKQEYLDNLLTKEDFDRLVEAARAHSDMRAEAIFETLYRTGLRVSELLQLGVKDVTSKVVYVKGKGNKYRQVFFSDKLRKVLEAYIKERINVGEMLFTGQRGPINRQTVHSIIKQYAHAAGVNENTAHAHSFRHLYCLSLIEKGIDISTVADLAGHSNINTTRIYTRKTRNQLLETINNL